MNSRQCFTMVQKCHLIMGMMRKLSGFRLEHGCCREKRNGFACSLSSCSWLLRKRRQKNGEWEFCVRDRRHFCGLPTRQISSTWAMAWARSRTFHCNQAHTFSPLYFLLFCSKETNLYYYIYINIQIIKSWMKKIVSKQT